MLLTAVVLTVTACSGRGDPPETSPEPQATSSGAPPGVPTLDPAGCPVTDELFCATAATVAAALTGRDAVGLVALSRQDTIDCAEVERRYVPGCETEEIVRGHGLSDADFTVDLVTTDVYAEWIDTLLAGFDPQYEDEYGDGTVRIVGVGTCGPDVPGRRTYHLAWTGGADGTTGPAQRVLGSFEFTFAADEWRIALAYVDSLAEWATSTPDPLREAFCSLAARRGEPPT